MRIHSYLTPENRKGPGKGLCLICEYGLHEFVDKSVLRGVAKKGILGVLKMKITREKIEGIEPQLKDVTFHLVNCSSVKRDQRLIAKKVRRALKKNTKSISEINEMVMGHISQALELSGSLSEEQLETLTPSEKMKFATDAAKLLQAEKKLSLDAQKAGLEKARFLMEHGKLASGSAIIDENEVEPELLPSGE
jgi:hypothetical protein